MARKLLAAKFTDHKLYAPLAMVHTQGEFFQLAGLPMVENCMAGYNSCMFAYGQVLCHLHLASH
jgi:hypothetical protein